MDGRPRHNQHTAVDRDSSRRRKWLRAKSLSGWDVTHWRKRLTFSYFSFFILYLFLAEIELDSDAATVGVVFWIWTGRGQWGCYFNVRNTSSYRNQSNQPPGNETPAVLNSLANANFHFLKSSTAQNTNPTNILVFHPQSTDLFASIDADDVIRVWDIQTGSVTIKLEPHPDQVTTNTT